MIMVEITEDKFEGLYENVEKGLHYLDKAMNCLGEMKRGGRSGMREHEEYDDMRQRDDRDRGERDYRSYGDEY